MKSQSLTRCFFLVYDDGKPFFKMAEYYTGIFYGKLFRLVQTMKMCLDGAILY